MSEIQKVVVIGAGNMGSGIAQNAAQNGHATTMVDTKQEFLDKAFERIRGPLDKRVAAGKMRQKQVDAIFDNLSASTDLAAAVKEADLVIEAVFEDLEVKKNVFQEVAKHASATCVVATNTSSFQVQDLGRAFGDASRVGGLHYFFPAMINKLVEVVKAEGTSDETFDALWQYALRCKKIPIRTLDASGFAVNRFFVPLLNEACRILEEDVADIPTIEAAANQAFGTGMGPFQLMNVTGVPIALHAQTTLHEAFGDFYKPAEVLVQQVEKGEDWGLEGSADAGKVEAVAQRLRGVAFGIACHLVDEGVASREDTDRGAVVGLRWADGPFALMNELGLDAARAAIEAVHGTWGDAFPVPDSLAEAERTGHWPLSLVETEDEDAVRTIRINRPEALNALNPRVLRDLDAAFTEAAADDSVRAIVLTGSGRSFVAGADIRQMVEQTAVESLEYTLQGQNLIRKIERIPKPVIGAVNGWALGGGCELALACDFLYAAESAVFGLPEVHLGIHPGFGGTQRLPRLVGPARAKELIFTGERITANQARELGLVNRVVPDEDLVREAVATALKISGNAPLALGLAKSAVNQGTETDLDTGLALEAQSVTVTFATDDQKEGMRAFLEGRKAEFQGR